MPTDKRLYPLATCSIGIWSTPDKTKAYLLLLPEKKLFVILLTREVDVQDEQDENALSVNGLLSCLRSQTSLWLRHKNPFVDHTQQPDKDRSVLTFEISWSNVVGMDFKWPLTQDARLVLEASLVVKRVFENVEAVCVHYQPQARSSRRRRPSTLQQLAEHHASPGITLSTGSSTAAAAAAGASSGTAAAARQAAAAFGPGAVVNKLHVAVAATDIAKQLGNHAGNGNMSRVSSWASWASWTSGRSSMERTPTALEAAATAATAAAAAADGAASAAPPQQQQEQDCKEKHQQQQPALECKQEALASQAAVNDVLQQLQQQEGVAECSIGSQISPLGPALHTAPTLEAGIAPGSLLAAALSGAAHSRTGSKSSDRETTPGPLQELNFVTPGGTSNGTAAWDFTPDTAALVASASAAAGSTEQQEPVLWPTDLQQMPRAVDADQHDTAGSNLAATAATSDAAVCVAAAVSNSTSQAASAFSCERSGASFGAWAQQLRPLRLLQDNSPSGYATAACSLPGSPKIGDADHHGLLLQHTQQQLLQLYQQQQQEGPGSRQSHQQKVAARDFSRGSSSRSSRLRAAAAAADRLCPLCNQPLLQPLNVLQQRFHDKQHDKQQHLESRSAHGAKQSSAGGNARGGVAKCRSACSLDQLLEQEMTADSCSPSSLCQQQQVGSTKSLAGRAAAAVGGLAARCVATVSASSSKDGTAKVLGVLSPRATAADTGAATASTATAVTAAAAAAAPQGLAVPLDKAAAGCGTAFAAATATTAAAAAGGEDLALAAASSAGAEAGLTSCGDEDIKPKQAAAEFAAAAAAATSAAAAVTATTSAGVDAAAATQAAAAGGATSTSADWSTAPADGPCSYSCRTVVLTFKDPTLPHQLKKVVNSTVHMLKLYESGLPAWAVFMPSYGLWYRPWLRRVTWLLFVLLSVVSMAMGFYDLYKNVPYFKQAIIAMFSPAAAVFEWLEHHTQIRLSILLTYMLGKSQIFVQLIKLLTQTSLQPIIAPIAAMLQPLGAAVSAAAESLAYLAQPFVALGRLALLLLQLLWQLVLVLLWSGPVQLLTAVSQGLLLLLQLLLLPLQAVLPGAASIRAGWTAAKATGQAAKAAVPVVKGAAATASNAARSTRAVWGWWWSPLEALELMRISSMRIVKSVQAVVRFFVAMLSTVNQHRLSLMLQLRQQLRGGLRAAAESPAGRVASAVAVKMGQEERVARLQERLRRTDSALVSVGSELLPADSVAVSAAFSLEGELSLGLMEALGRDGNTPGNFPRSSQGGGDSDDEVTSGVTAAPVSPAQVSPAQAYGNGVGLRYRGGGTVAGSSNRPGTYSRLGTAGSSFNDTSVQQLALREDMQQQRVQGGKAAGCSSSSKQVTFAAALAEQQLQPGAQHTSVPVSSEVFLFRRSLDAGIAAAEGQLNVHMRAFTFEEEQELLLQADKFTTLRARLRSKSGSSLGARGYVGQQVLAASAAVNSDEAVGASEGQLGVDSLDYGSPESGHMSRSCDVSSVLLAGAMDQRAQPAGVNGIAYAAASGAVAGASGTVHAGRLRRNSWG